MSATIHLPVEAATPVGTGLALRVSAALVGGALSIHQGTLEPGQTIPTHVHDDVDQLLYVVDGRLEVTVGSDVVDAAAGDFVLKPHGVPHSFTNPTDEPATALEITVSDQFERFTEAAAALADPGGFPELQRRFGMRSVPPTPLG